MLFLKSYDLGHKLFFGP